MLGICKVDRKMENCFYKESKLSLVVLQWRNTGQSNRMLAVLQRLDGARNPAMCTSLCLKAILSAFWGVTGFHDRSRNIAGFGGVSGAFPLTSGQATKRLPHTKLMTSACCEVVNFSVGYTYFVQQNKVEIRLHNGSRKVAIAIFIGICFVHSFFFEF